MCLAAELESGDLDDDTASLLQADYEIGHFIRERIVPRAVLYFTGEACDVSTLALTRLCNTLLIRIRGSD